jgi:hypothetical protein
VFFNEHGPGLFIIISGMVEFCRKTSESLCKEEMKVIKNFFEVSGSMLAMLKKNEFKKAMLLASAFLGHPNLFDGQSCLSKREVKNSRCLLLKEDK